MEVICNYCGNKAELVDSKVIYGTRSYGMIWLCRSCEAYVGTHKYDEDNKPLGTLAKGPLRELRKVAHKAFDKIWIKKIKTTGMSKFKARGYCYKWLAKKMGISKEECHIAMLDDEGCKKVIEICGGKVNVESAHEGKTVFREVGEISEGL